MMLESGNQRQRAATILKFVGVYAWLYRRK